MMNKILYKEMQYLIANNREYDRTTLEKLNPKPGDTIGLCNFWYLEELPDWEGINYVYFVRNIGNVINDRLPFEEMVEYIKPNRIFYIEDRPNEFLSGYAKELGIDFEMVPAYYDRYPGGYPSTGFMAALQMPDATLVGFEGNDEHYGHAIYHNFIYEREFLNLKHEMILL